MPSDLKPVAYWYRHPEQFDGEPFGTIPLTLADIAYGWTETPLYAHPPAQPSGDMVEAVARAITPLLCGGQEDQDGRTLPDRQFDELALDWQEQFKQYATAIIAAMQPHLAQAKAEGVRIGLEAAAKEGEVQQQSFLSPEYATGQPLSSLMERTAVKIYMQAIRELDPDTIIKDASNG